MPDPDRPTRPRRPGQPSGGAGGPGVPRPRVSPFTLAAAVVISLFLFMSFFSRSSSSHISLTELQQLAADREVGSVKISDTSITGELNNGRPFITTLSNNFQTQDLVKELQDAGVDVELTQPSPWVTILANVLPIVLLLGVLYWFML